MASRTLPPQPSDPPAANKGLTRRTRPGGSRRRSPTASTPTQRGWCSCRHPPPLPTVAPTRVPTVHSPLSMPPPHLAPHRTAPHRTDLAREPVRRETTLYLFVYFLNREFSQMLVPQLNQPATLARATGQVRPVPHPPLPPCAQTQAANEPGLTRGYLPRCTGRSQTRAATWSCGASATAAPSTSLLPTAPRRAPDRPPAAPAPARGFLRLSPDAERAAACVPSLRDSPLGGMTLVLKYADLHI